MTEQELLRTALILPPRARAVLCVWAAIPGLLCAPFVFWPCLKKCKDLVSKLKNIHTCYSPLSFY